ncbi:hypothetical protein IQE94_07535 [Synechocystis sp. PCC 7339]|uniref:hypothetical protein n=1 Tax=unclassified Synechocystis TaxID=2640012 RepID=UPI001BAEAE38|nr:MULTISPECIES: hypothetical protein [unclassified Synechocystis]QUS61896.1 hypothetical protein HTZ78_15320 [Synechocystis sp. PCC 7338]UAJ74091.1 hypothetical protein IQE94_07535 [Synechocystis sp. PCC 7339]
MERNLKKIRDGSKMFLEGAFGMLQESLPFKNNNQEEKLLDEIESTDPTKAISLSENKPKNDPEEYEKIVGKINLIFPSETLVSPKSLVLAIYPDKNLSLFQKTTAPLTRAVCEKLYESTQYLRIDDDLFFKSKSNKIQDFRVIEGEECDDDIHLVKIHLKDNDERFNQRINQIDRIRAFRELPNLVDDIKVSPRLRIEAGNLFKLYHR